MLLKTMRKEKKIEARHFALWNHIVRLTSGWMSEKEEGVRQHGFSCSGSARTCRLVCLTAIATRQLIVSIHCDRHESPNDSNEPGF